MPSPDDGGSLLSFKQKDLIWVIIICFCFPRLNLNMDIPLLLITNLKFYYPVSVLQVSPQAADVMELFIHLGEPCHVCQVLLTISHGADSSTFPSRVDVRTGRDLDGLKLVVEV